MTDPRQPADRAALRERLADELREVVIDALRERQPDDWDPELGVDEWTDAEYLELADVALRTIDEAAARQPGGAVT